MSIARLLELGKEEIGCVSTGNVGTAVASLAAKAGVAAYVFYPNHLEARKARACRALGAKVCQVEGNYDEANRACRELAAGDRHGVRQHHPAPVLRRGREDGGVRDRRAARLERARPHRHRGRRRHALLARPQGPGRAGDGWAGRDRRRPGSTSPSPSGCNPIATAILAEEAEIQAQRPNTAAHSLAIGAPGDGYLVIDAVRSRGGIGGDRDRPGDLRGHRPARRHRGDPHRAGRRHDGRGAREAGDRGRSAPTTPSSRSSPATA